MCGLAGILKLQSKITPEDIQAVKRMTDAQIHRGPDDFGLYNDDYIALGHRRLSIIDLSSAGKQPMGNNHCPACKQKNMFIQLIYNGEIYNYNELRAGLIRSGHIFHSNSDTEVIMHGYVEWGIDDLLERLRGMFAFALYETRFTPYALRHTPYASRLILARDRLGIKPLYYYQNENQLTFASEVKSILKSDVILGEHNKESDIAFLIYGHLPEPMTSVKDVYSLPAGSYLVFENGKVKCKRYYNLIDSFSKPKIDETAQIYDNIRAILTQTTGLHLISDAPLGVFLSGGLDSSALVAIASLNREEPLTTLSVVFDEEEYSEQKYQRLIAEKFRTEHVEVKITEKDFYNEMDNIFGAMDQPTDDGVNTYFVAKAAKKAGLKTVLSGAGGDEVFCGYDSFKKIGFLKFLQKLPQFLKFPFSFAKSRTDSLDKLSYLRKNDPLSLYLTIRSVFTPLNVAQILNLSEKEVHNTIYNSSSALYCQAELVSASHSFKSSIRNKSSASFAPIKSIDWLSYMELSNYLKNQLLKDMDFMSMYHSVETRVPYLDHQLVDYIASVNSTLKTDKNIPKPLLVNSLNHYTPPLKLKKRNKLNKPDLLPNEIIFRRKQGFTFPFDIWLRKQGRGIFEEAVSKLNLNRRFAKTLWRQFENNRLHWSRIWSLIVLNRLSK